MTTTTAASDPKVFFKPYLQHKTSGFSTETLSQRNYKYAHFAQINSNNKKAFKILRNLKYISSLSDCSWLTPQIPLFKKLLKPHRKSLRSLHRKLENSALQKFLPQLTQLHVALNQDCWRLFLTGSGFRKVVLDFDTRINKNRPEEDQEIAFNILRKNKYAFRRSMSKMKDLSHLQIEAGSLPPDLIIFLLEIISENRAIESLKEFGLGLGSSCSLKPYQPPVAWLEKVKRALDNVTDLFVQDAEEYSFLFSSGELKNLSKLHLDYRAREAQKDLSHLARFKDLEMLRKLTIKFEASSLSACEIQFFEKFSLPPALEILELALGNFIWNAKEDQERFENSPPYDQFFEQFENCQNLKVLNLKMHQKFINNRPALAGKFVGLLLQRLDKLREVSYSNYISNKNLSAFPMDLGDFWKGLRSSKETLESISLDGQEIIFPQERNVLEMKFPRLTRLYFKGKMICSDTDLSFFWKNLSSLKGVALEYLEFTGKKQLDEFLLYWRFIPRGMGISLTLNGTHISQADLIDCFTKYILEVNNNGGLSIAVNNIQVQVQDMSAFHRVLELAEDKGCFQTFWMSGKGGNLLFSVSLKSILKCANGLFY